MVTDRRKLVNVFLLYYIVSTTNNTRTTSRTTSRSGTDKVGSGLICTNTSNDILRERQRQRERWVEWTWLINKYMACPDRAGTLCRIELQNMMMIWVRSRLTLQVCILIEEESSLMEIWWLNQTSEFGQNCVMNNFWWGLIWSWYFIFLLHSTVLPRKQNQPGLGCSHRYLSRKSSKQILVRWEEYF